MSGKRRVLITGGTGYIGSALVSKLLENHSIEIALVVRNLQNAEKIFTNQVHYIEYNALVDFTHDILTFSPDVVIHLAAYSTSSDEPKDIKKLIESNIIFTANLLIALSHCKLKLFVNTGSFSEYHEDSEILSPTYFYSATKTSSRFMIEYYAKKYAFNFINVILFTVYGKKNKHKKIIDYAIDALESEVPIKMSDGKQILDFVHIDDVVNFYYHLITNVENIQNSKIDYQIGYGECVSIRELVRILEDITQKTANIDWGANRSRKRDTVKACADIQMAKEELHYSETISLLDGLRRYVKEISKDE